MESRRLPLIEFDGGGFKQFFETSKTTDTVKGAHCVTADDRDQVYVCDPVHGKILVFKDSLPSSK